MVPPLPLPSIPVPPTPAVAATPPVAPPDEEDGGGALKPEDDLNLRAPARKPTAWKQHANPWLSEEDEEESFQLREQPPLETALDMTPMVDVVMLLLIFFMITASFATQKSLESSPPEPDDEGRSAMAASADDIREDSVVVTIDDTDKLYVDDVAVAGTEELAEVLRTKMRAERKTDMLIEADRNATHGMVVAVTDVGIEVQMQHIRRATRRAE